MLKNRDFSTIRALDEVLVSIISDFQILAPLTWSKEVQRVFLDHARKGTFVLPDVTYPKVDYAEKIEHSTVKVVIAGAGGAAHLPGMLASKTTLPVLGVPIETRTLKGLDSLLSINQMPKGIPVGTLAIGESGAVNAALLAASIIGLENPKVKKALSQFRKKQTQRVLALKSPRKTNIK